MRLFSAALPFSASSLLFLPHSASSLSLQKRRFRWRHLQILFALPPETPNDPQVNKITVLLHEKWPMISKVKRILILKELSNISIRSEETFAYVFNCSKEEFRKQIS